MKWSVCMMRMTEDLLYRYPKWKKWIGAKIDDS